MIEDNLYGHISEHKPEMEREIRQLAEHALKVEEAFTLIEIRLKNTRLYPTMVGEIAIETDNLIEEWTALREVCSI